MIAGVTNVCARLKAAEVRDQRSMGLENLPAYRPACPKVFLLELGRSGCQD